MTLPRCWPLIAVGLCCAWASGAAWAAPTQPARGAAPFGLTSTDGEGLTFVRLEVSGLVQRPLAYVELHMTFENPADRVREGRFAITLPTGASVARFAMKLDGRWQEGEMVERQKAQRAYDDFLHRRQDPALLEHEAGNEFSARVFPIPARGQKELILAYSCELKDAESFVVPLRGLPGLGDYTAHILVRDSMGNESVESQKRNWVPDADLTIPAPARSSPSVVRAGNQFVARVSVPGDARPEPLPSLALLVDTSASRAAGFESQIGLVQGLASSLPPQTPLLVAAFDQEVSEVFAGPASAFDPRPLVQRRALGATDLERALTWLTQRLAKQPFQRVLIVGDGVVTAGLTGKELDQVAAGLKKVGVQRLDALAVGGIRDDGALGRLARAGLPQEGMTIPGTLPIDEIVARLKKRARSGLKVRLGRGGWVQPATLDGVQPGDEVLIHGEVPAGQPVEVRVGDQVVLSAEGREGEPALVARACAAARVATLEEEVAALSAKETAKRAVLGEAMVQLSTRYRVSSPLTAFLVLETEQDYQRYGIERRSAGDIWTVGKEGLVLVKRSEAGPVGTPPRPKVDPPNPEAFRLKVENKGYLQEEQLLSVDAKPEPTVPETGAPPPPPPAPSPAPSLPQSNDPDPLAGTRSSRVDDDFDRLLGSGHEEDARTTHHRRVGAYIPPAVDEGPLNSPLPPGTWIEFRPPAEPGAQDPWDGKFAEVMKLLREKSAKKALDLALRWREEAPGDVLALLALGEASEALADWSRASRAYGSIIDLFPSRADLRRLAGNRLERVGEHARGAELAVDAYRHAVEQRPDHPGSHHLLGIALLRAGRPAEAFEAFATGLGRSYPPGRFAGVQQILAEDLGLAAAAWERARPKQKDEIEKKLLSLGGSPEHSPSLRFVLSWETDANDVDFHIHDRCGGHAYYSSKALPSGGNLYADVTTGYGPECFTIRLPREKRAYPYWLDAHYFSRGPMGYGMGQIELIEHDGNGGFKWETRPFVVMRDQAFVDIGKVEGPLPPKDICPVLPPRPSGLSQSDVMGVVVAHKAEIKRCAAEQKARAPDQTGTVFVHWLIQLDGTVTDTRAVNPKEGEAKFDQCMVGVVKGFRFPPFSGTAMPIDFPFKY